MDIDLRIVLRERIEEPQLAACGALWGREWPPNPDRIPDPRRRRPVVGYALTLDDAGAVRGAVRILACALSVDGSPAVAAGFAGVVVEEGLRGGGHGARMAAKAVEWCAAGGWPWIALFCKPERRSFYERLGFARAEGPVVVTRHGVDGAVDEGDLFMIRPLDEAAWADLASWRGAEIRVGDGQW